MKSGMLAAEAAYDQVVKGDEEESVEVCPITSSVYMVLMLI